MQTDDEQQTPTDTTQEPPPEVVAHLMPEPVREMIAEERQPSNDGAEDMQSWKGELEIPPGVQVMPND